MVAEQTCNLQASEQPVEITTIQRCLLPMLAGRCGVTAAALVSSINNVCSGRDLAAKDTM